MGYGEAGFLLGALPGLALVLRNMWQRRVLQKHIEAVAWKERDWNNTQLGYGQQAKLITKPQCYIDPDDSPEIVKAKEALITALPKLWRRHWAGGAIMFLGAIAGTIIGSNIG